jgi:hypothetical protein
MGPQGLEVDPHLGSEGMAGCAVFTMMMGHSPHVWVVTGYLWVPRTRSERRTSV